MYVVRIDPKKKTIVKAMEVDCSVDRNRFFQSYISGKIGFRK